MTSVAVQAPEFRERPLIFSPPMVLALLEGRKTQTRRLYKPRYPEPYQVIDETPAGKAWPFVMDEGGEYNFQSSPYGVVGDRLWVKETWRAEEREADALDGVRFKADDSFRGIEDTSAAADAWVEAYDNGKHGQRWRTPMYMPRWASRLTLELTAVRFEKLQDLTEADAKAEGMKAITKDGGRTIKYGVPDRDGLPGTDNTGWPWQEWEVDPRRAYAKLWNALNGERAPWTGNPWVWVLEFKAVS